MIHQRLRHRQQRFLNNHIPRGQAGAGSALFLGYAKSMHTHIHTDTHMYHTHRDTCTQVRELLPRGAPSWTARTSFQLPYHHLEPQWYLGPLGCRTVPGIPWRARIQDMQDVSTPFPGISRPIHETQ